MGLFDKLKEPVFLKESSSAEQQIEQLKALEPKLNEDGKARLRQDIKLLEYGIIGEKNIAFELKNSHLPMYILHDIYLESGDLSAQIDYLVFTRKLCFVVECKNLYGDIEITNSGEFVRTVEYGGKKKREGIYSPITQNMRHLELMKKIRVDNKAGIIGKFMANRYFEDFNKPVVVLANPKTVLNSKYAKKEIKSQIIRADQLVAYIKDSLKSSNELENNDEDLKKWAESYLRLHSDKVPDYTVKYDDYMLDEGAVNNVAVEAHKPEDDVLPLEETALFQALRAYRLKKSREENIKPYMIYNDNQLKDMLHKMPKSKDELLNVTGFGPVKVEKYGEDVLRILHP